MESVARPEMITILDDAFVPSNSGDVNQTKAYKIIIVQHPIGRR